MVGNLRDECGVGDLHDWYGVGDLRDECGVGDLRGDVGAVAKPLGLASLTAFSLFSFQLES